MRKVNLALPCPFSSVIQPRTVIRLDRWVGRQLGSWGAERATPGYPFSCQPLSCPTAGIKGCALRWHAEVAQLPCHSVVATTRAPVGPVPSRPVCRATRVRTPGDQIGDSERRDQLETAGSEPSSRGPRVLGMQGWEIANSG
ncbi:uncharacterized protein BDZ99DRAFT_228935 [Mytilinidion resinicola]|uniref:Uncharacterized protein n=1 Tax=Mytilinidion resinicola TaxID=574789 RepID=A0A6A6YYF4_9PEZI|nr:uncharacterized protein BDZ99DRAFT_228935 [Mytilinidion resinicola]KAF2813952.1 hypothetical protein BDZ99DRAFT_228935 [Mytilinidion resinicola]